MAQFHELTVTAVEKTIRDAVAVTLQPVNGADFSFIPGQYLTFRRDFDGQELRRSYSICAGGNDTALRVGIKQVKGGTFSTWANTALKPGDRIEAMAPRGDFFAQAQSDNPHILAFAAGSGITPILSILKTHLENAPSAQATLIYGNRSANTIMFRDELADLKDIYLGRFTVIHVLGDGSDDIDLFRGRIDADKCAALFDGWIDLARIDTAYICGPQAMMQTISKALLDHGLARSQIRFELFGSAQPGRARTPAKGPGQTSGLPARVTLNGESRSFDMSRDTSLLQAALDNSIDAPYACRGGVCSTCKAKVTEGEVEMLQNHALEDYEVEQGFVLTCQAHPVSDKLAWDYDQAGH